MKKNETIKNVLMGLVVVGACILCVGAAAFLPLYVRKDFLDTAGGWHMAQLEVKEAFSPQDAVYADQEGLQFTGYIVYHYDKKGNRTEEMHYERDGTLNRSVSSQYDERGNLTVRRKEYPLWGWSSEEIRYEYDEKNRLICQKNLTGESLQSWTLYGYRIKDGMTCESIQNFSAGGTQKGKTEYVKNEDGSPLDTSYYDQEGKLSRRLHYEYDQQGRQCYYILQNGSAKNPMREIYTQYEGQDSLWVTYEPLGHFNALEHVRHDDAGNKISAVYYLSGYQGYKESQWNTCLKFWEGYWADYCDGLLTEELEYSHSLKSYKYYVNEGGKKKLMLQYEVNGGIASRTLTHYLYDVQGRLAAVYKYRITGYEYTLEGNGGSVLKLNFSSENGYLEKIERSADKQVTDQLLFDKNGKPQKLLSRFGELPRWGDACPWQNEHFPWEEPKEEQRPSSYVVKEGDCLWEIAKQFYGNADEYWKIYEGNRSLIGEDENLIQPGMKLVLP